MARPPDEVRLTDEHAPQLARRKKEGDLCPPSASVASRGPLLLDATKASRKRIPVAGGESKRPGLFRSMESVHERRESPRGPFGSSESEITLVRPFPSLSAIGHERNDGDAFRSIREFWSVVRWYPGLLHRRVLTRGGILHFTRRKNLAVGVYVPRAPRADFMMCVT